MAESEQTGSFIFRYLLVALLPVVAAVIYIDGQRYDPGLLDFRKADGETGTLTNLLPDRTGSFERVGAIRSFSRDNLFEHINGHAEYFISGGFTALAVADYGASGEKDPCCSVDIYQMGTGANAFGVLMGEVSDDFDRTEIGFMGFVSPRMLSFIRGPYYVKIGAYREGAPLEQLAAAIDGGMGGIATAIPQLERFPKEGAVAGSLRYFREAYRGLDFLNRVFEQDYDLGGVRIQAALVEGDEAHVSATLEHFLTFFKEEKTPIEKRVLDTLAYYIVSDPFEGEWRLLPRRERIFMLYGPADESAVKKFLVAD